MTNFKLNTNQLKYIAIFAMLLDHIAWSFLAFQTPLAQTFHFIGRITAPIMCYFVAQGYDLTRNRKKYSLRLFIFAMISQVPWMIYHEYTFEAFNLNMIFTLFICFLAIEVEHNIKNKRLKNFGIFLCCLFSIYCDWLIFAVLYSVLFYRYKDNSKKKIISFCLVSLLYFAMTLISASLIYSVYTLGTFMALGLISIYDKDKPFSRKSKWVFYIFYPLHLLILALFK